MRVGETTFLLKLLNEQLFPFPEFISCLVSLDALSALAYFTSSPCSHVLTITPTSPPEPGFKLITRLVEVINYSWSNNQTG